MRGVLIFIFLAIPSILLAQEEATENKGTYKKRVLENIEVDLLGSYYVQDGQNAAVTGGIGTEELDDWAGNIHIAVPLNDDDILTIDGTVSAYSSASSSNLNPFSGASNGGDHDDDDDDYDDDDDDDENYGTQGGAVTGSPWVASSGASREDTWVSGNIGYSHASDDRNSVYKVNANFANEYDYTSFGTGFNLVKLYNKKNTELGVGANIYFDFWDPEYPTEIKTYIKRNGNLNEDFFYGVDILNQDGSVADKNGPDVWKPLNDKLIDTKSRNTFSLSLSFSQILSKRAQFALFSDITLQNGWLANPMQRVYFADIDNFYIGNKANIPNYTKTSNTDVFQLADDIERLPNSRIKIPIGTRLNFYVSEFLTLKTYYRYYFDTWGLKSNTLKIEAPIKIGYNFTVYPSVRFYDQSAAKYFAPYEEHLSTSEYYTSDYDLSAFNSIQYGFGLKYANILKPHQVWRFVLKNLSLNYAYYERSTGLNAHIVSLGAKFAIEI